MKCNWKRYTNGVLLASMLLAMLGCGSDNDSAAPATGTITGNAIKGPLRGGVVEIYKMTDKGVEDTTPIGTGVVSTDGTGSYTVKFTATTGPVIIKVKGSATATYLDEVTNTQKSFSATDSFRAVVPDVTATTPVAVTPLTEIAAQQLATLAAAGVSQEVLAATIATVNKDVAAKFGLTDITLPPTAADVNYLAVLTTISKIVNDNLASGSITALTYTINNILKNAVSTELATRTTFAKLLNDTMAALPTTLIPATVAAAIKANVDDAVKTAPPTTTTPTTPTTPNLSVTVSGQVSNR